MYMVFVQDFRPRSVSAFDGKGGRERKDHVLLSTIPNAAVSFVRVSDVRVPE